MLTSAVDMHKKTKLGVSFNNWYVTWFFSNCILNTLILNQGRDFFMMELNGLKTTLVTISQILVLIVLEKVLLSLSFSWRISKPLVKLKTIWVCELVLEVSLHQRHHQLQFTSTSAPDVMSRCRYVYFDRLYNQVITLVTDGIQLSIASIYIIQVY